MVSSTHLRCLYLFHCYVTEEARLKDKLALAAREKLAQASKENQIKAERKRRAAMFINMLKSSQVNPAVAQETKTNGLYNRKVSCLANHHEIMRQSKFSDYYYYYPELVCEMDTYTSDHSE